MWAFVTIIISQITFPLFWNISSRTLFQPQLPGCLILCFCRSAKWPTTQLQSWTGIWQWRLRNSLDDSPPGPAVPQSPVSSAFPGWQIGVSPPHPHRRPSLYLSVLVRPSLPVGHPDLFILFLSSPVPHSLLWVFWYGQPLENICCWQRAFT